MKDRNLPPLKAQDIITKDFLDKCTDKELRELVVFLLPLRAVYGALITHFLFAVLHIASSVYGAYYLIGEKVTWSNGWKFVLLCLGVHLLVLLPVRWLRRYTLSAIHPLLEYI